MKKVIVSKWLPWVLVGLALLAALLHEAMQTLWGASLSSGAQAAVWALALLGLGVIYLVYSRFSDLADRQARLQVQLAGTERLVEQADQRMDAIFQIGQIFVEASDENEVIEPVLRLLVELTGAQGAAFVPLDEHGQPQTALSHGELPQPLMEAWNEHLASSGVRERCKNCRLLGVPGKPQGCPLLMPPGSPFSDASGMLCLSVHRGERDFGIASLFLSDPKQMDERTCAFLRALMDETALGLEGVQLRRRELVALRQMQLLRQKTDLTGLLGGLLENVFRTLEADFAVMVVPKSGAYQSKIDLTLGDFPTQARPFVDGILQGVMASGESVLLGDVSGDTGSPPGLRSLAAAPLVSSERSVLGAILVGNRRARGFHQRQLAVLQTVAGQVALVVQNASLMAELEYKTLIQERARLAREIHDGLAQTIGFLKLQAAQLRKHLTEDQVERARQGVDLLYTTLSDAYQDARQAIDGLRVSPTEYGLGGWLEQMASEFQQVSGLPVEMEEIDLRANLPSEIQAQLIRILQEALSNVRKHARASRVWIACRDTQADLVLEVRDDGDGFAPEDISSASQHGLRGMRERAELIGADFQVVSRPQEGTTVRVRLPVAGLEEVAR